MALPPKDMHLRCLACRAPLGEDDDICPGCGADRRVEMAIAAELDPEIASLKKWLLALGAISIGLGLLTVEHLRHSVAGIDLMLVAAPSISLGIVMFILAAVARRAPFAVPIIALSVFGLAWMWDIMSAAPLAFGVNFATALRVMFILVLVGAMQAGYRARQIRAEAEAKVARAA